MDLIVNAGKGVVNYLMNVVTGHGGSLMYCIVLDT
jgi:hypothetical protein